jgi:septum site-determining protein MinC
MREQTVTIKGVKDGLLVALSPTEEWNSVMSDLATRIDQQSAFFSGARITLDLGTRPVPKDQIGTVKALLERRGLSLWAISSESQTTIDAALALDLRTSNQTVNPSRTTEEIAPAPVPDEDGSNGVLIRRTLRSGRRVMSHGHVVVYGDVNPGAEIIAGGDVIIWGRLRGNVHAGANGDESAVVCALEMIPTQLRIAGHITISPDTNTKRGKSRPEIAFIRDREIMVEAWK